MYFSVAVRANERALICFTLESLPRTGQSSYSQTEALCLRIYVMQIKSHGTLVVTADFTLTTFILD